MYMPNLKSVSLPVPEIIAIEVLGFWVGVANPQLGEEEAVVRFKRTLVISYTLSIVTFPLPLCVSEILPLLCSSTPFFPTIPLVFPKFSHVALKVGGWPLGYQERRFWANCPYN